MEHHQKDADGKVVEHEDTTPSSVEEQELKEYSPNVAYQAKGGKKSGKLGKSSVYSLRGKDESKKDFRKSHVKDVEGGYVGGGHKPTPGSLKKEDYYRGTGEKVVSRTREWMKKKGQKGAPGLDAMKARTAEHKAKRGVKEENALEKRAKENEKARKWLKKDAKDSGYTDIALKASLSKGAGVKEEVVAERLGGKGYKPYTSLTGKKVSGDWEDSDRGAGNKAKKRAGGKVEKKSPTYRAHVLNKEEVVSELNRYERETGTSSGSMNMPKGRPTQKGGTSSRVMRAVRTSVRRETGKPTGQTPKIKGEKGRVQYGDRKTTPADTIAKRRQAAKDADAAMRDTRGT